MSLFFGTVTQGGTRFCAFALGYNMSGLQPLCWVKMGGIAHVIAIWLEGIVGLVRVAGEGLSRMSPSGRRGDIGTGLAAFGGDMARRTRDGDGLGLVLQLMALAVVGFMFVPGAREWLRGVAFVGLGVVGVIGVGVLVWFLVRKRKGEGARLEAKVGSESRGGAISKVEVAERLRGIDWFQFEKVAGAVYEKLGFQVRRLGGAKPDGGIDLILEKEGEQTAVQCKHWKLSKVKLPQVREFLGALTHAEIRRGVFITLHGYTDDAKGLAEQHGIATLDEEGFSRLFEEANGRFDPDLMAVLLDARKFCPKCESEMTLRRAERGSNAGGQFWGCSKFPRCKGTMEVSG